MQSNLPNAGSGYVVFTYTVIVFFFLVFNPQSLKFHYGDGGGRYEDRVDSFSEHIIRNTIKRNILNKEDNSILPIVTKGYSDGDYAYYKDDYKKYFSSVSLQTVPASFFAKIFNIDTERKLNIYFGLLRLINALLLSFFLCIFVLCFCKSQGIKHHFLVPFLIGASSGFVFYSQNLWFASALMLMPATLIAFQLSKHDHFSKVIIFLLGTAYFLRGYEFATIFALLTAFSAMIFANGNFFRKVKLSAVAFIIICISFAFSVFIHIVLISADSSWTLSFYESAQKALSSIQRRTASIDGVPFPLSSYFVQAMNERWLATAFSLTRDGIKITEINIILLIGFIVTLRLKKMSNIEKIIVAYGVLGYSSWYIFAYQHIMWHSMYDWYIFSLTMGFSFILLANIYINMAIEFLAKYFMMESNKDG